MTKRSLDELIDTREPGIDLVRSWIREAKNPVTVLGVERATGERSLLTLQITSRSPLGAVALATGGLLVDHGWIRVLGAGSQRLPRSLHEWNGLVNGAAQRLPGAMLVGDDVLGGFFAINGGGLAGPIGHVFYHSPQSLLWEDVADSYSEWLAGLISGDLALFYQDLRWPDWHREVESLSGDLGFSIYPVLFAQGSPIAERSRKAVPVLELWQLFLDSAADEHPA